MKTITRYDRMVAGALSSRFEPQGVETIKRISKTSPTLRTARSVSENDIYSYGFAFYKKEAQNPSKRAYSLPNESLHLLQNHYIFNTLYHKIKPFIHSLSTSPFHNDQQHDIKVLATHIHGFNETSKLTPFVQDGFVIDSYR
ncbi:MULTISPECIES: hypothetical protein [Shouchella]|uniref:Uncharacterized protein n=2 Tax=Shouchella TaxID=2893057 RepID=A0ABY7W926_9BACI|nr:MULTISPECIES: hypothetical protein [Shouchella]MED4127595.1 hypothetical protein [Shouchella miscanthi]WDF04033.1 hypothetical protein PQ477_00730 [Shouchella hunanensis]